MFWKSNTEKKIDTLTRYMMRWRYHDMANWSDLAAKIIELKRETERVFAVLDMVRNDLKKALECDAVDQLEVQKAHDAIAEVVADMDQKIHADGV
jgi:hypothetical protein